MIEQDQDQQQVDTGTVTSTSQEIGLADTKENAELIAETKSRSSGSAFYKNKIEELERTNNAMLQKLEEQKTIQLKEKENYKELWEIEKGKRITAEEKSVKLSKDYLAGLKMSAIEQEALKAGIIPEALSDIRIDDASMVEIETGDRGTVSVNGAKEYIEFLKETKKHWFNSFKVPKINTHMGEPVGNPKDLTPQELIKLQKKDPTQYAKEMNKRLKLV